MFSWRPPARLVIALSELLEHGSGVIEFDLFDVRRARHAPGLLREFNDIEVLAAADVHVALRIAALASEPAETVILAAALAVRAPRVGHVVDRRRSARPPPSSPTRRSISCLYLGRG